VGWIDDRRRLLELDEPQVRYLAGVVLRFAALELADLVEISHNGRQVAGLALVAERAIAAQMVSFTGW
jgi:hypothetical protein